MMKPNQKKKQKKAQKRLAKYKKVITRKVKMMQIENALNKYWIIAPGVTLMTASELSLEDFLEDLRKKMHAGETVILKTYEQNAFNIISFSPGMHITIMDEETHNAWRREQMFAQASARAQQGGLVG